MFDNNITTLNIWNTFNGNPSSSSPQSWRCTFTNLSKSCLCCQQRTLTVGGALTDSSAGLPRAGFPREDLDLDAVLGPDLQVGQNHTVLLDFADASGLQGATEERWGRRSGLPTMPCAATGQPGKTRTGSSPPSTNVKSVWTKEPLNRCVPPSPSGRPSSRWGCTRGSCKHSLLLRTPTPDLWCSLR